MFAGAGQPLQEELAMSELFSHRSTILIVLPLSFGFGLAFALPWLAKSVTAVFNPVLMHYLPLVKR